MFPVARDIFDQYDILLLNGRDDLQMEHGNFWNVRDWNAKTAISLFILYRVSFCNVPFYCPMQCEHGLKFFKMTEKN